MPMKSPALPWYRQRWPWLLMIPPLTAIVAGAITVWIAVVTADGLVVDDYYKQGLAVNQRLARDEAAQRIGISATLMLSADGRGLRAMISAKVPLNGEIRLRLAHPTRNGYDQEVVLSRQPGDYYEARLEHPLNGRRIVSLESTDGWRVVGDWDSSVRDTVRIGAATE